MKTRKPCDSDCETVEHPFGTRGWGATHFLTKTLPMVATEMALIGFRVAVRVFFN
jgi:hypothetical protein